MVTPLILPTNKKIVLGFGTYDKLHPGHEFFLKKAREYGDYLVVIVARDKNVEKLKGKLPVHSEHERRQALLQSGLVDQAILGRDDFAKRYSVIADVQPSVICLGYDQAPDFVSPDPKIRVVRLAAYHPEKYKSSLL